MGLAIQEAPILATSSMDTLISGDVVTVEPEVYLPRRYGVRIKDTVLVGESRAEVLTQYSKELRVLTVDDQS